MNTGDPIVFVIDDDPSICEALTDLIASVGSWPSHFVIRIYSTRSNTLWKLIGCTPGTGIAGRSASPLRVADKAGAGSDEASLPARYVWVGRVRSPSGPGARQPHIPKGVASEVQPSQEWDRDKRTQRSRRDDGHEREASTRAESRVGLPENRSLIPLRSLRFYVQK